MTTPLAFQDEMPVFKRLATVAEIANMTPEEYRDYIDDIDRQRTKNAIAMKKNGASIDFIVKCLGMTPEEVEALPTE